MSTNKELMQRRSNAVPRGVGQIHPIFAERAENCRVWDVEGREFLDFAGGIAVLKHRPPAPADCLCGRGTVEKAVPYLFPGTGL